MARPLDPPALVARALSQLEPGERRAYLQGLLTQVAAGIVVIDGAEAAVEGLQSLVEAVQAGARKDPWPR